jgi:hypothetical protein
MFMYFDDNPAVEIKKGNKCDLILRYNSRDKEVQENNSWRENALFESRSSKSRL